MKLLDLGIILSIGRLVLLFQLRTDAVSGGSGFVKLVDCRSLKVVLTEKIK